MDKLIHYCEPMQQLSNNPVFELKQGKDTATNEDIEVVFLHIATVYSHQSVQVYFCPWCGTRLTPYDWPHRSHYAQALAGYREYRKRHVKSDQQNAPLGFAEWQALVAEFDELDFLLRHAKPEHTDGLFRRKQRIRDRLALGIVLRDETAEDFVQKVRQWKEATPDFYEDFEPYVG